MLQAMAKLCHQRQRAHMMLSELGMVLLLSLQQMVLLEWVVPMRPERPGKRVHANHAARVIHLQDPGVAPVAQPMGVRTARAAGPKAIRPNLRLPQPHLRLRSSLNDSSCHQHLIICRKVITSPQGRTNRQQATSSHCHRLRVSSSHHQLHGAMEPHCPRRAQKAGVTAKAHQLLREPGVMLRPHRRLVAGVTNRDMQRRPLRPVGDTHHLRQVHLAVGVSRRHRLGQVHLVVGVSRRHRPVGDSQRRPVGG